MIKIDNDTFYISAGETCYIFKIAGGVPMHVYFGKRVEPEDDLTALGLGGNTKELCIQAVTGGKKKDLDFAVVKAWIMTDDDGNSKSLVVELRAADAGLNVHMYYTPHPRGGIYRRVAIKHEGSDEIKLAFVRQSVGCGFAENAVADGNAGGFFASCGENGDAYGFLCPNADGNVDLKRGVVTCENSAHITMRDVGDEVECPELLCVYSDTGKGGVSRVFHDILREDNADLSERAAVLFLPKMRGVEIDAAVKAAGELGFGVVALDCGRHTEDEICALDAACRKNGLIAGVSINREYIEATGALFTDACRANGGIYKYDNSDKHTAMLYHAVRCLVANYDIKYVMIDAPEDGFAEAARGMFAIKNMLNEEFDGLRVDFCIKSQDFHKAFTAYYPLEFVRNVVSPDPPENFKTRFDVSSLGALGYAFNPTELSDGIKRAVRAQILSYQDDARCVLRGDIYGNDECRMAVSKDKSRAYAVCYSKGERVKFFGLDEHNLYHVRELNKTFSGAALIHCGIAADEGTSVFHILQVADY